MDISVAIIQYQLSETLNKIHLVTQCILIGHFSTIMAHCMNIANMTIDAPT